MKNMITSIIAMMLTLPACQEISNEDIDKNKNEEIEFEGGAQFSFLESMKLVTPSGTVKGEIDEENNIVIFRHLPLGTVVKSALIGLTDGAELLTPTDKYNGNWPEEMKIVIQKDGDMSSYKVRLADYVGTDDTYYLDDSRWTLEWSEEFNTSEIDWNVWKYCHRHSPEWADKMSPRKDLTLLKDGNLEVWAKVNDDPSDNSKYVTGGLWGEGLKGFKPGRVDVRVKKNFAKSFWPAVWMMPNANVPWPDGGEIDIMEHLNYDNIVYQTVHSYYTENISKDNPKDHSVTRVDTRQYHIYSVEVFEDRLIYYVDNKPQLVYKKDASKKGQYPFADYEFYMILSAQLGGNWPGEADGKDLPAAMYVDFVRYYAPKVK